MPQHRVVFVIVLNAKGEVLVENVNGNQLLLHLEVHRFARLARAITREAELRYGLRLFCFALAQEMDSQLMVEQIVAVTRLQHEQPLHGSLRWVPRGVLHHQLCEEDLWALRLGVNAIDPRSSFGRYESLDVVRAWYTPFVEARQLRETRIEQWNGDSCFQLFRIICEPQEMNCGTHRQAFWFKAVGDPNTREFTVIRHLTAECRSWFAPIVAMLPEVNGWLMEEVPGCELDKEVNELPWVLTAEVLAKLQMRFVGREQELLAIGCKDWRVPQVIARIDPFFEHMVDAMEKQSSVPPLRLSPEELCAMAHACKAVCKRILDLGVPNTLAHGDFSPHNVLVSNGSPVFIDWAEAYLTFPFISWEYYWNRTRKDHPEHAAWWSRVQHSYGYDQWASMLGHEVVQEGFRLSPAYAILVSCMYRSDGDIRDGLQDGTEHSRRSMVRRLQRELQPILGEVTVV